jgi:uncharacterized membrane protein
MLRVNTERRFLPRFKNQGLAPSNVSKKSALLLLAIVILGALLGIYGLAEKSYWDDELLSMFHARSLNNIPAFLSLQYGNAHPPLYFLLLRFWMMLGGQSEGWTRLLSVLLGLPALVLIFLIGKRLSLARGLYPRASAAEADPQAKLGAPAAVDDKAGLWASLLYAIMPLMLIYNRELRMYSLFVTLSCLTLYLLLRIVEEEKFLWWALYSLATFLTLIAHYHGLLVLFAQGLFFLLYAIRSGRPLPKLLHFGLAAGAALLLFLPFLPALLDAVRGTTDIMWRSGAKSIVVSIGYLAFSLALGQTIMPWNILAIIGALGFAVLLIAGLKTCRKNSNIVFLMLSYGVIVFIVGPIISHNMPRYYLFFVPLMCLFLATGLARAANRIIIFAALALLLVSWASSGLNYYAGREFHVLSSVDPTREVADYLSKNAAPGDAIIGGTQSLRLYYLPQHVLKNPIAASLPQFLQNAPDIPPTVWLVVNNPISTEKGDAMRGELTATYGYKLEENRRFLRDPNFARKQKYFKKPFAEYRIDVFRFHK